MESRTARNSSCELQPRIEIDCGDLALHCTPLAAVYINRFSRISLAWTHIFSMLATPLGRSKLSKFGGSSASAAPAHGAQLPLPAPAAQLQLPMHAYAADDQSCFTAIALIALHI